jgi:hypothetical protein
MWWLKTLFLAHCLEAGYMQIIVLTLILWDQILWFIPVLTEVQVQKLITNFVADNGFFILFYSLSEFIIQLHAPSLAPCQCQSFLTRFPVPSTQIHISLLWLIQHSTNWHIPLMQPILLWGDCFWWVVINFQLMLHTILLQTSKLSEFFLNIILSKNWFRPMVVVWVLGEQLFILWLLLIVRIEMSLGYVMEQSFLNQQQSLRKFDYKQACSDYYSVTIFLLPLLF